MRTESRGACDRSPCWRRVGRSRRLVAACAAAALALWSRSTYGGDAIFPDDFESGECSAWSASSNPVGAPDQDGDAFGDEQQPTTYCELPLGFVPDATDCDDGNESVHPDAVEICNDVDDDCDGSVDPPRDTNPVCGSFTYLGTIDGDQGSGSLPGQGYTEQWYRFVLNEGSNTSTSLRASIQLTVPADLDLDLYVYCVTCGGTLIAISNGGLGVDESVVVGKEEVFGLDDTTHYLVEVRHFAGASCANWSLLILGNTGLSPANCPS